jgi:hypothetical protein
MALDLEIAGAVRELSPDEGEVTNHLPPLKRLRDSHHAVAKLVARGMSNMQVSLQTGYHPARVSQLQNDPTFKELVAFYRKDGDTVAQEMEAMFLAVGRDFMQEHLERLHDTPEDFSPAELREAVRLYVDRAGFAPIQRSINKSVTRHIGERLDEAKKRVKDEAA